MKNNLVVKANKLNESRYKLSVQEQRVVLSMISMIQPDHIDFTAYRIKIKDFIELVGLKGESSYSEMKKVTRKLISKTFIIKENSGDLQLSWISSAKYFDHEAFVELRFDPLLKPYLFALKKEFTRYQLKNTIRLKSIYSIRIYELLKQYQSIGTRYFELKELRDVLGIPSSKLSLFGNFKVRVLEKAKKELKNTDLLFEYAPKKTGRRITGLNFFIRSNDDIVKKSKKNKKRTVSEMHLELDLKKKIIAIQNEKFNRFSYLYPKFYKELKKEVTKNFNKKEKRSIVFNLTLRLKMKDCLDDFLKRKKLEL